MTIVHELLEEKVNEVFLQCQDLRHIKDGDIDPMMSLHLDDLMDILAKHITRVLDYQTSHFNMMTTLEVLKDFHSLKRGSIVYAQDTLDFNGMMFYEVLVNNVEVLYVPEEICRVIGG